MAVALEPLIFNKFKGIREFNGVNSGGEISAIECENVELVQTDIGGTTGIKSMAGNTVAYTLPDTGYVVKGIFTSEQDNVVYEFIYAENTTQGRLYYIDVNNNPTAIISTIAKSENGECNGLTMSTSAYDVFVFTNGEEAYTVCFTSDATYGVQVKPLNFTYSWKHNDDYVYTMTANPAVNDYVYTVEAAKTEDKITAVGNDTITVNGTQYTRVTNDDDTIKIYRKDYEGNDIKFLAMTTWNGRLVVATDYGVRASHDNDIYTWNDNPTDESKSWYINYTERVTALYAYTGGLFIFTDDNTDFLSGNPLSSSSVLQTTAGVGCHSFNSIVKHDTYLFFYSDVQKNIYMIQNIDNGQTRPTGPLARDVQSAFKNVKDLKLYSCIYDSKSQIWAVIDDNFGKQHIYIYDYNQGEWVQRKELSINTLCLVGSSIQVGRENKVYIEFLSNTVTDMNYKSMYKTSYINAGSNTNLKKQKTPLLLVLNDSYINDFFIRLTVNGKPKGEKRIKLSASAGGIYGSINETLPVQPAEQTYGSTESEIPCATYGSYNPYSKKVVEVSTPQTWYTLGIEIYTQTNGQGFYINSMELKNIKAKLKTRGR